MKKYVILIDAGKCNQCYACSLACKDEHFGNDYPPISLGIQELGEDWVGMHIEERGSGSKVRVDCWPEYCRHCDEPDCAKASAAVYKRPDGIVIIDPEKAKGDKALVDACPYHAIAWNAERLLPQKCTFCAHLLDNGEKQPRCVEACPNGTLTFGDMKDPKSEVARLVASHPELQRQKTAVRYFNKGGNFIAGSVYLSEKDVAAGAKVRLLLGGRPVDVTETDGFGDFKFEDLPDDMAYQVEIEYPGFAVETLNACTPRDVCFEEITLKK